MRVAVLPTGRTEWLGLPPSLNRLFPSHTFDYLPTRPEYESEGPYNGFTSIYLTQNHEAAPPEMATDLVAWAAQEALGDRNKAAADLVLIIDDLELDNAGQPARVVAVMRKAVEKHLEDIFLQSTTHTYNRTKEALSSKVSFHLIAPMIEAWFFADPQALQRAGVPVQQCGCFPPDVDPEAFVITDASYIAAIAANCQAWSSLPQSKQKKHRPKWLGAGPRDRHPKGYLQWFCRAPAEPSCTNYSETNTGGPALANIRWDMLLGRPGHHFQFLRALIEDLEEKLGQSVNGPVTGNVFQLTARSYAPQNAVLRNI